MKAPGTIIMCNVINIINLNHSDAECNAKCMASGMITTRNVINLTEEFSIA
jgi:hypothetical protein